MDSKCAWVSNYLHLEYCICAIAKELSISRSNIGAETCLSSPVMIAVESRYM